MLRQVQVTKVPREAMTIASRYERIAKELRDIADEMAQLMSTMEGSWEGNAKQRFFAEYGSEAARLRATADFCSACGKKIRTMTVTTTEWKLGSD